MLYSQATAQYLLPAKRKYTMRDVAHVMRAHSLCQRVARFVVVCSAIYHNTDYSAAVRDCGDIIF